VTLIVTQVMVTVGVGVGLAICHDISFVIIVAFSQSCFAVDYGSKWKLVVTSVYL